MRKMGILPWLGGRGKAGLRKRALDRLHRTKRRHFCERQGVFIEPSGRPLAAHRRARAIRVPKTVGGEKGFPNAVMKDSGFQSSLY